MRRQSLIVLGIALFLAIIATYLVNTYIGSAERQRPAAPETMAQVVVAQVPMDAGAEITPEKVRFVSWPSQSVPSGAFASIQDLLPPGKKRVTLRSIEAGEPILKSKLAGEGGRASLSAILPSDLRAVAIRITDVAGAGGFILPGDRVDVIMTRGEGDTQVAQTIMQDVQVVAIDQDSNDLKSTPSVGKTATVAVAPYDAQKLVLAQSVGSLSLALRAVAAPRGSVATAPYTTGDLRGRRLIAVTNYRRPVAVAAPRPRPAPTPRPIVMGDNVEIVRGMARTNYEVSGNARH